MEMTIDHLSKVAVCSRSFSKHPTLRAELLARYRQVTFNDAGAKLEGPSLVDFLQGHDKAIVALERIDEVVLALLPQLKTIAKQGVGLDSIDIEALRRRGIRLGWRGGINRRSVAELALCLMLASLRHVVAVNRELINGRWRQQMGNELTGRTVGIVGFGHVGKDLVELLKPFRCRVLAYDVHGDEALFARYQVERVALEVLLADSDIVSLHAPLTEATANLIDATQLALMKPTAVLVNTARGGLVHEGALKTALLTNALGAAAFDVFVAEPPADLELVCLPNFIATAHISGSTEEAVLAMGRAAIEGLDVNAIPDGH